MNSDTKPIGMALPDSPDPDDVNRAARRKAARRDRPAVRAALKRRAERKVPRCADCLAVLPHHNDDCPANVADVRTV